MDMRVAPNEATEIAGPQPADRPPRYWWKLGIAATLALAMAAMAMWWLTRGPAITVVRITRGSAAEIVYATGSVEPETWSRSTPLVRGRLVERCRCEGKTVKRGDMLARLDDKEAVATLNDLRALEDFQHREFDRQAQLLARGVATSQAYQKAESDLARIRAQIAAQAQRLEYYKLVAPMDGTVLKEDGEVGDMVEPGTILYRIGLEKPLWVVAEVNEEDIPRVKVGQKALLRTDAFASQVLPGFVKQITPAGDPIAKTFRVRIGLPDDTPLRVGMSVEANIVSQEAGCDPRSRQCRRQQLAVYRRKRPGAPAQSHPSASPRNARTSSRGGLYKSRVVLACWSQMRRPKRGFSSAHRFQLGQRQLWVHMQRAITINGRGKDFMNNDQLNELLYQALETEQGGIRFTRRRFDARRTTISRKSGRSTSARRRTTSDRARGLRRARARSREADTRAGMVVRHIGESLVKAMEMALEAGEPEAAEIVACGVRRAGRDQGPPELGADRRVAEEGQG